MKKSKVTKVTKLINDDGSPKKDNWGNCSFIVAMENGDQGFYNTKDADQKKFVIGQETEYNIQQKQGSKGFYNKITLPQAEGSFQAGGGFKGKSAPDPKVQMISFAMSYTKDLIVGGKVQMDQLEKVFNQIHALMISKL